MSETSLRESATLATLTPDVEATRRQRWAVVGQLGRLVKDPRVAISGAVIILLVIVALLAPLISPYEPEAMDYMHPLAGPSSAHWLGTDQLGRDVLTRLIYGARLSLQISVYSVALAFGFGVTIGVISSFFGSWIDSILMRLVDILLAFPALVLAITVAAYLGPSLRNIVLVIAIVYMPIFARLTYVVTRAVKQTEYVEAARTIGATPPRIILRAILPNSMAPLIVQITLSLGFAILTESGLSFLGVGVPPPATSWGAEIAAARLTLDQAPFLVVWPSITIALAILSFNILGDSLRDLLDPRLRHR